MAETPPSRRRVIVFRVLASLAGLFFLGTFPQALLAATAEWRRDQLSLGPR